MSIRNLDSFFAPKVVALAGASARPESLGHAVLRNLRAAAPDFELQLVNPRHKIIDGLPCAPSLQALPERPDLVIIATPGDAVTGIVEEAAALGVPGVIVITADPSHGEHALKGQLRAIAQRTGIRIIGPNCLGVIAPHGRLNASFAAHEVAAGDIAIISQSGALTIAILSWAARREIGFSGAVSLGDMADVGFADMLDHFALDRRTRAILLYVESIPDAKRFMSAARAAARVKPVIVIKAGRHPRAAQAAATHTGALAGADDVYDAALRRAGLLRVNKIAELFDAASALGRISPFDGDRLAILTNGGGLGVLAVDELLQAGGQLAEFSAPTLQRLDSVLPEGWSHANPADIVGDADPARFRAALEPMLADPAVDAIAVMHCPTALSDSAAVAKAVCECVQSHRMAGGRRTPVFAAWLDTSPEIESLFRRAEIPLYWTGAIEGFMHMVHWRRRQATLMAAPPAMPVSFTPDRQRARQIIAAACQRKAQWLEPLEVAALLQAYDIPFVETIFARDAEDAAAVSAGLIATHGACVIKLVSPQIIHKSDLGGVVLDLKSPEVVQAAASAMFARIREARPDAIIEGLIVQPMVRHEHGREVIAGLLEDPVFGPVILFGQGGKAVEIHKDRALDFPPLDLALAHDLVRRTRVAGLLAAHRDEPAADIDAIAQTLVKLAQISADHPQIIGADINPLIAHEGGVIAIDARFALAPDSAPASGAGNPRLVIAPYPGEQEKHIRLRAGERIFLRPVRPDDEGLYHAFLQRVSPGDLHLRFFSSVRKFDHRFIARLTQVDYARAFALIAIDEATNEMTGAVRLLHHPDGERAEYAILVRSDWQGRGLGWALMEEVIAYGRNVDLRTIEGQVLADNVSMQKMCRELGFEIKRDFDDKSMMIARLDLRDR